MLNTVCHLYVAENPTIIPPNIPINDVKFFGNIKYRIQYIIHPTTANGTLSLQRVSILSLYGWTIDIHAKPIHIVLGRFNKSPINNAEHIASVNFSCHLVLSLLKLTSFITSESLFSNFTFLCFI